MRDWLAARGSVDELLAVVRALKQSGLTQADATEALNNALAAATDGECDDRIRDVLDFVAGWCPAHARIWP